MVHAQIILPLIDLKDNIRDTPKEYDIARGLYLDGVC